MYYKPMEYYNHRTRDSYEIVGGEYEQKNLSRESYSFPRTMKGDIA